MGFQEKVQRNIDLSVWHGKIPVRYRYTLGLAGEKFFETIKSKGKLLGTFCPKCDMVYSPPAIYCERCFSALDEWVEVGPGGTIVSFTVCTEDDSGADLEMPVIIGAVQLDGADTVFIHRLCLDCLDGLSAGARVKAVFKDKKKRTGGIDDIEHFELEF